MEYVIIYLLGGYTMQRCYGIDAMQTYIVTAGFCMIAFILCDIRKEIIKKMGDNKNDISKH